LHVIQTTFGLRLSQQAAAFANGESICHFQVPQGRNQSAPPVPQSAPDAMRKIGNRVVQKPGQTDRSIEDEALQTRPSLMSSLMENGFDRFTRLRISSMSAKISSMLVLP
jgi:hypothetical protein